jgi:hypothetical protein
MRQVVSLVEAHSVGVRKVTEKLPFRTVQVGCLAIKASVGKACQMPLKQRRYPQLLKTEDRIALREEHALTLMSERSFL